MSTMSIPIYKIHVFSEGLNSYGVSRDERWELKYDTTFTRLEDAKEYVRQQSRQFTILPNFLQQWRETKEEDRTITTEDEVIEQFCFIDDKYLQYRRFFIYKPNVKHLQQVLQNEGIVVKLM